MITWRDSFLLFGGYQSQTAVQQFNHTTQQWKVLSTMPTPRAAFGCAALPNNPDKILLVGGDPVQKSAGIYNPVSDTWEPAASPSIGRKGTAVVQLGNRIFAVGGQDSNLVDTDTSEEYNVATNSWSFAAERIVKPKMHIAAAVIPARDVPNECIGI
jgi:N-acetylneuraminic acid mutarotase